MKNIQFKLLHEVQEYITFKVYVCADDFSGSTNFCVERKVLEHFYDSLKNMYNKLSGKCKITDTDSDDFIEIECIKNGHITVRGQVGGSFNEQFLKFRFETDQTYLDYYISDMVCILGIQKDLINDMEFKKSLNEVIKEITEDMKEKLKPHKLTHWKDTDYGKSISIKKLVAEYDLESMKIFPYTHCKARIWYCGDNSYLACSNIGIIDTTDGYNEDGTVGFGTTAEESLDALISNTIDLINQYEEKFKRKLTDKDYCYSDPDDF